MMSWFRQMYDRFANSEQRPASYLSDADAREISARAIADAEPAFADMPLMIADVSARESKIIWTVATATKGSGVTVAIDDASGRVLDVRRWGVR